MKDFPLKDVRLDEKEFNSNLGRDNFIFIGSSCDMWANDIPKEWITKVLGYASIFKNRYLFQTKNPGRFLDLESHLVDDAVYGTTIETNRSYPAMGTAPDTATRAMALKRLSMLGYETMVTIEPIMKFDLEMLVLYVKASNPLWVNIGADSKGNALPEPTGRDISFLIDRLEKEGINIKEKSNLGRLLNA